MTTIEQLEQRVVTWAEDAASIRAVLVIGSRARRDHPGDEWSDLDLMIFATDFTDYLDRTDWLGDIGEVWVCVPYQTGAGDPERLVLFDGGQKVDFVFFTLDELNRLTTAQTLPVVYHRGYYVLVDKDGLAAQIPSAPFDAPPSKPPSEGDFLQTVNRFWYGAVYVAKQIRRRELWITKFRDGTMKEHLLKVMEWHAQSVSGHDTWHEGHFLREWVEPGTWDALYEAFGRFDAADSWRALLATMDLFRRLAIETAARLDYGYPDLLDERVTRFVNVLYSQDDRRK